MKKFSIPKKLSKRSTIFLNLAVAILCTIAVVSIWLLTLRNSSTNPNQQITKSELSTKNGQNGNPCWVAVDGVVYDMSASGQWSEGLHLPSNNQAYCGQDGSAVISRAPHGRDMVKTWPVVGQYVH